MAYGRVLIGAKYQHSCKIKLITCWEQGFLSPSFNQNSQVCPSVPFQTGNSIRLIKAKGISARYSKHCNSPLSLSWSCSITHCHRGMGLAGGQGQCMCFLWLRSTFLPFRVTVAPSIAWSPKVKQLQRDAVRWSEQMHLPRWRSLDYNFTGSSFLCKRSCFVFWSFSLRMITWLCCLSFIFHVASTMPRSWPSHPFLLFEKSV